MRKAMCLSIDEKVQKNFKAWCAKHGLKMNEVVEHVMKEKCSQHEITQPYFTRYRIDYLSNLANELDNELKKGFPNKLQPIFVEGISIVNNFTIRRKSLEFLYRGFTIQIHLDSDDCVYMQLFSANSEIELAYAEPYDDGLSEVEKILIWLVDIYDGKYSKVGDTVDQE